MRLPFPHQYLASTDSTNVRAMELLSKINPEFGFMIITDFQTGGKGQFGRVWSSDPGQNLLCSSIFGPLKWPLTQLFALHLFSSLSLWSLLAESGLPNARIKWPNDLYVGDCKIGGILIENILRENILQWSVVGIGLNVHQHPGLAELATTSLQRETGQSFSIEKLAIRLHSLLIHHFKQEGPWLQDLHDYNEKLYRKGLLTSFVDESGHEMLGRIKEVLSDGRLCIEDDQGNDLLFTHGEIRWSPRSH